MYIQLWYDYIIEIEMEVLVMIIAVDFDGTLCRECYPEVGVPNMKLINFLINRRVLGDKLIL